MNNIKTINIISLTAKEIMQESFRETFQYCKKYLKTFGVPFEYFTGAGLGCWIFRIRSFIINLLSQLVQNDSELIALIHYCAKDIFSSKSTYQILNN